MDTVGLYDHISLGETTFREQQIVEVNLNIVHAGCELKRMRAPWPEHHLSVNYDPGGAGVKEEGEWKEAGGNLNSGPWLLGGHDSSSCQPISGGG